MILTVLAVSVIGNLILIAVVIDLMLELKQTQRARFAEVPDETVLPPTDS